MKTKIYAAGALTLAVLALLHLVRDARQARTARAEQARWMSERTELHRETRHVANALALLKARENGLNTRLRATAASATPTANPVQARIKVLRAWYTLGNARLYQQLGLSAELSRQLEDLQAAHWLRLEDIDATRQAQGFAVDDPSIKALREQETAQFQQAEAALLGPTDYPAAQEYDRLSSGRMVADAVAGNVFDTDSPLTGKQASALAQIVANNSPSYQGGGPALTRDMDFQGVLQQAQQVLNPTQLGALQNYLMGISAGRSVSLMTDPDYSLPPVN